jgi:lipoate-protein ligase A
MLCIISDHTDPYFNLASEEVLLKAREEEMFLLYRNRPSVVVGKHQNTLAEINLPFVMKHGILVARRISGGGTVFHDLGNLNYAFITTGKEGDLVDYRRYTLPLIEAMKRVGLDVKLGERHELLLGGKKISGTASHVYKNRVLHHGTLLFASEMEKLTSALRTKPEHFEDRAVKSVRSEVTNIADHLADRMDIGDFQKMIYRHILDTIDGAVSYHYSQKDLSEINRLKHSKFSSWEWNFGYSPKYQFNKLLRSGASAITLHMNVDRGVIREVSIEGDFSGTGEIRTLEELLTGTLHDPGILRLRLSGIRVADYIEGLGNEELLAGMF